MQMNPRTIFSDTYESIESTTDLKENKKLSGIQIPNWNDILTIALKCQRASKLGYVGVDIALDIEKGPVVFELNARPGLGIQVANQAGLRWRLEKVKGLEIKNIKHGIRVAQNLFGGEIEESIEAISGRKVVSITEKVVLFHKGYDSKSKKNSMLKETTTAFMDTGILTSRITKNLISRMGYLDTVKYFDSLNIPKKFESLQSAQKFIDENLSLFQDTDIKRLAKIIDNGEICVRPVLEIKIKISGDIKDVDMVITEETEHSVVIGRGELKGYLIDTSKTFRKI